MVEKKVEVKVVTADFQVHLTTDKGKSLTEFEKEGFDMIDELSFEFGLSVDVVCSEKIENVGVFENLCREVRVFRWESEIKVIG